MFRLAISITALFFLSSSAFAGEIDGAGYVGGESRGFWQHARHNSQTERDLSIVAQPELYWQDHDGSQRAGFVGFARFRDGTLHADVREAHWSIDGDGWDITLGVDKVFWGVAESRHLVDVINQTDLREDIDQEQKLGQPMVNVNLSRNFGRFELFVLPYFRERTFPGRTGRLRPPLPVDTEIPRYESSAGQHHVDYALRYSHFIGNLDVGLSLFDGTSREPVLVPSAAGHKLVPVYEQMSQIGIDLQYTHDAWLWKLEAIARDTARDEFLAVVAGFEYTSYRAFQSAVDVGWLVEALYDGRGDNAPPTTFDNDVFVGTRLAFNDTGDTAILAGMAVDVESGELFANLEAQRRFGDNLIAEVRMRAFGNASQGDRSYAIARDDYVQVSLRWFY